MLLQGFSSGDSLLAKRQKANIADGAASAKGDAVQVLVLRQLHLNVVALADSFDLTNLFGLMHRG